MNPTTSLKFKALAMAIPGMRIKSSEGVSTVTENSPQTQRISLQSFDVVIQYPYQAITSEEEFAVLPPVLLSRIFNWFCNKKTPAV